MRSLSWWGLTVLAGCSASVTAGSSGRASSFGTFGSVTADSTSGRGSGGRSAMGSAGGFSGSTGSSGTSSLGGSLAASASGPGGQSMSSTVATSSAVASSASTGSTGATTGDPPGWTLAWSDEFEGPDGGDVDPTKWVHEVSGNGNGNMEREYYTAGPANAYLGGGYLHIVADALPPDGGGFSCWYGPCWYTSGKIQTTADGQPSLFQKQYGRFSARMKIPEGIGVWPAFWMLGVNIDQVGWPTCGEIDVMENVGMTPATVYGTLHGPNAQGQDASLGGTQMLPSGNLADDFHVYSVEWQPGSVTFLLDDTPYFMGSTSAFPGTWVFDGQPFYLILNLAIGGDWPGDPDPSTVFPSVLLVDWVRVYDPSQ